jgi:5-methylcytosine-specific restriction endonuclease McrA
VKRGGPLRRLTPLRQTAPLKRRKPLRARVSDPYELRKARKAVRQRSGGRCEGQIASVCIGKAMHAHHIKRRSGQGKHDPENLVDLCAPCHEWVHANPKQSMDAGLLRSRYA